MRKKLSAAGLAAVCFAASSSAAPPPSDWKSQATLRVDGEGLVRTEIPLDVLSAAKPGLDDLLVIDSGGKEVPYLIERALPHPAEWQSHVTLTAQLLGSRSVTVADFAPNARPIDAVMFLSPTPDFLAAATVEMMDEKSHRGPPIVRRPVFRQSGGPEALQLDLPPGHWTTIKLTLEPAPGSPMPVLSDLTARLIPELSPTAVPLKAEILDQTSDGKETRVRLRLPASNLWINSVSVDAGDRLFTRRVDLLSRSYREGAIQEEAVGQGTIFRVAVPGGEPAERLNFDVSAQLPSREAVLRVANGDSRPLSISGVQVSAIPAQLVFLSPGAAPLVVAAGNDAAAAPEYDLAALKQSLDKVGARSAVWEPLAGNPAYAPREPLPGIDELGSPIDVAGWPFRKRVSLQTAGVQALELDLESLAHERSPYEGLRLVRGGRQVPFVTDETGLVRSFNPGVAPAPPEGRSSRWSITLPYDHLPVASLSCAADKPLFSRRVSVIAPGRDDRGDVMEIPLGAAEWTRLLGQPSRDLTVGLASLAPGREMTLSVDNGDNPPLSLSNCRVYYRTNRLLFKASPGSDLFLYYGKDNVSPPVYDLRLAAGDLFAATQNLASLAAEERLETAPWWQATAPTGWGRWVFWGVLCAVVAVLLLVIGKLLPEQTGTKTTP